MSNQIGDFKAAFNGGTRPNRFTVSTDNVINANASILIKAASMPPETIGILQLPYRGRVAKIPGDRVYAEWTITVLDDTGGNDLRGQLRAWHNKFNDHVNNTVQPDVLSGGSSEFKDWTVTQLDMTGSPLRSVTLVGCWPVEIGPIELSYDTADTATEFSVTIAYDYLETSAGQPGGPAGPPAPGDVGGGPDIAGGGGAFGGGPPLRPS